MDCFFCCLFCFLCVLLCVLFIVQSCFYIPPHPRNKNNKKRFGFVVVVFLFVSCLLCGPVSTECLSPPKHKHQKPHTHSTSKKKKKKKRQQTRRTENTDLTVVVCSWCWLCFFFWLGCSLTFSCCFYVLLLLCFPSCVQVILYSCQIPHPHPKKQQQTKTE